MKTVLMSPWRGGTPRRLCNNLGLLLRTPDQYEADKAKYQVGLIVNWGCCRVMGGGPKTLNPASAVATAANKLSCLKRLHDKVVPTLEYTLSRATAREWVQKSSVIGHFNLHAHSAQGLSLFKKGSDIPEDCNGQPYKLYTKYFPKKTECRVHCIQTKEGDYRCMYLEKKRVLEGRYEEFHLTETPQTWIRTWDNGWIFARDVSSDLQAIELAKRAMEACGLAYGAVDIMFKDDVYVVGEINTAPGLEGQALAFYVANLGALIEKNKK
jgi:hypothetical protein